MSSVNTSIPGKAPQLENGEFFFSQGIAAAVNDFLYFDNTSKTVKPFSQLPDQGSSLATMALAAQLFAGVSLRAQPASLPTALRAVFQTDYEYDWPCVPSTFEVGDFVAPAYTPGALPGPLSDQLLTKVTAANPTAAIGRVRARYPVATSVVKVRITSRLFGPFFNDGDQVTLTGFNVGGPVADPPAPQVTVPNNGTIAIPAYSSGVIVSVGGNVTGISLAPGTQDGQQFAIFNNSNATITFGASNTSLVADGTSAVISAFRLMFFAWSATLGLWMHT